MSEEIKQNKTSRGRPKKVTPPVVNEEDTVLHMTEENAEPITVQQIQKDMSELFNKSMQFGHDATWMDNFHTLQSNNPFLQNQRLKMISDIPGVMSGEELAKALGSPQTSEIPLRRQGWSLSSSQYLYYKILRMAADVPLFKWYKTPEFLQPKDYINEKFIEEDKFVDEWLQKFDMVNTLKRVSMDVKREGKSVYVLRNSIRNQDGKRRVNYCTWQKMPSDYVKLTGIGEHGYIASFNMLLFMNPAFSIDQYPDFIRKLWRQMIENGIIVENSILDKERSSGKYSKKQMQQDKYTLNINKIKDFQYQISDDGINVSGNGILEISQKKTYMFWVQLPQELCYVFCSDSSNAWAVPDTSGLFVELQNLTDYDTLAGLIASTPLTAMLTAEVPLIAEQNLNAGLDQTALSPDTIIGYTNKFNSTVSNNVDAYIAPFKNMKLQSLPNIPNSSDITTKATQNFVTKSGMGGLISTSDKPSVSAIKAAQLLYEAECDFVTRQFESVLNMIINSLIGCNYQWKLHIWGGIYTFDSEVKRDKELFVSGGTFVLPKLASAYNMNLRDIKGVDEYIKSLDLYGDFQTVTQATQAKAEDGGETNSVGRPKIEDSDIDNDNTAASVDAQTSTSETREFAVKCLQDGVCMICHSPCDNLICDDCISDLDLDI